MTAGTKPNGHKQNNTYTQYSIIQDRCQGRKYKMTDKIITEAAEMLKVICYAAVSYEERALMCAAVVRAAHEAANTEKL